MAESGTAENSDCVKREDCCPDLDHHRVLCAPPPYNYLHVANQLVLGEAAARPAFETLRSWGIETTDEDCCCMEICGEIYCISTLPHDDDPSRIPEIVRDLRRDLSEHREDINPHYVLSSMPDAQWTPLAQPLSWREHSPISLGLASSGIKVGILDDGWFFRPVSDGYPEDWENPTDDPALKSCIRNVRQWFGDHLEYAGDLQIPEPGSAITPSDGHGPFAASVVLQQAPGATVIGRPVSGRRGLVTDCDLARALCRYKSVFTPDEHGQGGVDVLNLSFGAFAHGRVGLPLTAQVLETYFGDDEHGPPRRPSPDIPKPVVVASAGNNGVSQPVYPAALPNVLSVGALNEPSAPDHPAPACWSNRGSWVYTYAPGSDVQGIYLCGSYTFDRDVWERVNGDCISLPEGCVGPGGPLQQQLQFGGWALWQGTSFAAPFVAGRIASLLADGYSRGDAVLEVRGTVTRDQTDGVARPAPLLAG